MTEAMPFLQKTILLSYDPRPFGMGSFLCPPSPGWLLALTSPRFPQTERCYIRSNSHLSSTYFHNIHGFVHILFLNQRGLTAVLP